MRLILSGTGEGNGHELLREFLIGREQFLAEKGIIDKVFGWFFCTFGGHEFGYRFIDGRGWCVFCGKPTPNKEEADG